MSTALVLAQAVEAQGGTDPAGTLVQYGALGVGVIVLIYAVRSLYGRLISDSDYHRARADRLEQQLREANALLADRLIPVLAEATKVMADSLFVHQRGRVPDQHPEDRR